MMRLAAKVSRTISMLKPPLQPSRAAAALPARQFYGDSSSYSFDFSPFPNPNADPNPKPPPLGMIKHGMSLARQERTEDSYARGLLVLEQCESSQRDKTTKGFVELARSTLLYERGSHEEAIEKLGKLQDFTFYPIAVKVDASEALMGIYLEHYHEKAALAVSDIALQNVQMVKHDIVGVGDDANDMMENRIKVLKGLIEAISGNLELAHTIFDGAQTDLKYSSSGSLSYAEFLHGIREFSTAKEWYTRVIQAMSVNLELGDPYNFGSCNMTSPEVAIGAACSLGQLEAHEGNFTEAEENMTSALKQAEEHFGPQHPKVGVILTCMGLMYQLKATKEGSSSLIIQEGLFRKAIELLKAPPLDADEIAENLHRKDIIALARGGYAETLLVQEARKAEGERMKKWAEKAWGNRWISLGEALEVSAASPKVPVIDTRMCRVV